MTVSLPSAPRARAAVRTSDARAGGERRPPSGIGNPVARRKAERRATAARGPGERSARGRGPDSGRRRYLLTCNPATRPALGGRPGGSARPGQRSPYGTTPGRRCGRAGCSSAGGRPRKRRLPGGGMSARGRGGPRGCPGGLGGRQFRRPAEGAVRACDLTAGRGRQPDDARDGAAAHGPGIGRETAVATPGAGGDGGNQAGQTRRRRTGAAPRLESASAGRQGSEPKSGPALQRQQRNSPLDLVVEGAVALVAGTGFEPATSGL